LCIALIGLRLCKRCTRTAVAKNLQVRVMWFFVRIFLFLFVYACTIFFTVKYRLCKRCTRTAAAKISHVSAMTLASAFYVRLCARIN
jgi:heme/copper-type cytochrome/quinol oxidase subunit 2